MIQQLLSISRNTFLESIRQPIFVVLLIAAALALLLVPSLAGYTLDDDNKELIILGLSTMTFAGMLLAAFTATGVITAEIENRTVLTVVSKPVGRPLFVLGKFLGVAAALGVAYWILSVEFFLDMRHKVMQTAGDQFDQPVLTFGVLAFVLAVAIAAWGNYFYRWVFNSTFTLTLAGLFALAALLVLLVGKNWQFQSLATEFGDGGAMPGGQLLLALLLGFEAVLIITAVAIAASTRLRQVLTVVVCVGVYVLALLSESLYAHYQAQAQTARAATATTQALGSSLAVQEVAAHTAYRLFPNLQLLWKSDLLMVGQPIPLAHVGLLSLYSLLLVGAALCLAVGLFQTREVG